MKMAENKDILKKRIEGLKIVTAPEIWSSIASELDQEAEENQAVLTNSIESLPQFEAPDVWSKVSSKLEGKSVNRWKYLAIAASISLVALATYLIVPSRPAELLTFSFEEVDLFEASQQITQINVDADDVLLSFIKQNCARLAASCQDPEFKALLEAYMELQETKRELNRTLEKSNDQLQVMKYLIKVEKSQTELGKHLLKKIKSI